MNRSILPALLGAALLTLAACGGDEPAVETDGTSAPSTMGPAANDSPAPAEPAAAPAADGALLDPNTATREELLTVPHFNEQLADAVIAGRPHGNMLEVDSLLSGLSEQQRDQVYGRLFKPLDLNSATGEEIKLIPRVDERMRHEFEEYRPYRGIEEFRREIGKYVDEARVAEWEKYVTIATQG